MKKSGYDQDIRDAQAWAKEWQIKQKNRRIILVVAVILAVAVIGYAIHLIIVHTQRTTFSSAEEMQAAMQGRYERDDEYQDYIIEGDYMIHTYWSYSHYDRAYAEKYGYDYEEDSVYDDRITEWDYRNGVIRTEWMGDYIVGKDLSIRRDGRYYYTFYKTDSPRPDPIDPSTLNNYDGDMNADITAEEEEAIQERAEEIEATEDAAEDAGATEGTEGSDVEA